MIKIGITNHPSAKRLPHPIKTIIAGAAPTAHLLAQLESKWFQSVHVYGLTYVHAYFSFSLSLTILSEPQRDLWALHAQLPTAFVGCASPLGAGQTCRSTGTRLRHLIPAPRRSPHNL